MNIEYLKYFSELAKIQHYGKAAKALNISQPGLSHAIKSLEEVLAKVDQSNVHVQSAVVKANEAVISNNIKTMTSQLDVLKRQFGFADAKSAADAKAKAVAKAPGKK